jgi:aryl-alcohol dehydrogenase-like predicted oxidoreductase
MKYRKLGKRGLKISEIGFGSWISCDDLSKKQESINLIRTAYDCGINYFDTADAYSAGRAETILGEALENYGRDSYVLSSKVYWPTGTGPNGRGLSRKHIMESIDQSLSRLKTDYLDIYFCHWFDPDVEIDETLRAMDDIVRGGKALYIGVSNWTAAQIAEGTRVCEKYALYPIAANQPSYNMFDRYIESESIPVCERLGIGQIVYSPLAQGVLTGKYAIGAAYPGDSRMATHGALGAVSVADYLRDDFLHITAVLKKIAGECGMPLSRFALAWVLRQQNVASALIGASRPAHITENASASGITLDDDVLRRVDEALSAAAPPPVKHNIIT